MAQKLKHLQDAINCMIRTNVSRRDKSQREAQQIGIDQSIKFIYNFQFIN